MLENVAFGIIPLEGVLFPLGIQSLVPDILRDYIPTFPKTSIPIFFPAYQWGNYPIFPLGMKGIPSRQFLSLERQVYRSIVDSDFQKIENLLNESNFDINSQVVVPGYHLTAMGMACAINNIEMAHYLFKRGVDIEYKIGPNKKTALHIAVENGHEMLAKFLLSNGANLYAKDSFGLNVYDKSEFRGYYHFKQFLDYFKYKDHKSKQEDYEEYKYTRAVVLEDPMNSKFIPSSLIDNCYNNKLNPDKESEKINLDRFEFFMFNQFQLTKLENKAPLNLKKSYSDLCYYNSVKF